MRLNNKSNNGGETAMAAFSLLELLIAVTVMALIFSALFSGISTSFNLLQSARENLRATQIMISRLEGLRLCAWSSSQMFNTNVVPLKFTDSFYPLGLNSSTNSGTAYTGTLTITTNPAVSPAASYGPSLALVTVTLAWTNGATGSRSIHQRTMSTYVAQYGLQNYVYYH